MHARDRKRSVGRGHTHTTHTGPTPVSSLSPLACAVPLQLALLGAFFAFLKEAQEAANIAALGGSHWRQTARRQHGFQRLLNRRSRWRAPVALVYLLVCSVVLACVHTAVPDYLRAPVLTVGDPAAEPGVGNV
jgi:hypothetical protein